MNHISQRNRLEMQLQRYMYFMAYCPRGSFLKLSAEMIKIYERIEQLKTIDDEQLHKQVFFQYETKQSKLNFKTV